MEREKVVEFIKKNKPAYSNLDFSWHSDEELDKIREIVETEVKLSALESQLERMRSGQGILKGD